MKMIGSAFLPIILTVGCGTHANKLSVEDFVGEWACSYVTTASPEEVRFVDRLIGHKGTVLQSGEYESGHSSGFVGRYRSFSVLELDASGLTEILVDYNFDGNHADGRTLNKEERTRFEQRVEQSPPLHWAILDRSEASYKLRSAFSTMSCERKKELTS